MVLEGFNNKALERVTINSQSPLINQKCILIEFYIKISPFGYGNYTPVVNCQQDYTGKSLPPKPKE